MDGTWVGRARPGRQLAKSFGWLLLALVGLTVAVVFQVRAQAPGELQAAPQRLDAGQVAEIETILRRLLTTKPEILLEAQKALETKLEQEKDARLHKVLQARALDIYRRPGAPVLGNPSGDVTIVEFYDYNCPYCRRASAAIQEVLKSDTKVRVVVQELPILSKGSEEAARVALAANLQGKYGPAHAAIAGVRGQLNEAAALKSVAPLGLDIDRLRRDMGGAAVAAELAATRSLAQDLQIEGTPYFVIGDRIVPGAPDGLAEILRTAIAQTRASGCKACAP